jgi:hypothetical protein
MGCFFDHSLYPNIFTAEPVTLKFSPDRQTENIINFSDFPFAELQLV